MADPTVDTLAAAIHDELVNLWSDLTAAVRYAHNGCWSVGCENVATRIVTLSRMVGATRWEEIDVDLLRSGVYERVYRDAGINYPPIDWDRVEQVRRRNHGQTSAVGESR